MNSCAFVAMNPEKHDFRWAVHSQGKQVAGSDRDKESAVPLLIQACIPPVSHGEREIRIGSILPGDLSAVRVPGECQGYSKFRSAIKRLWIVGKEQIDISRPCCVDLVVACG